MQHKDAFSSYHPIVNFLYFGLVFGFSMFFMHPVCLMISFSCSIAYYITLKGKKAVGFLLKGVLPLLLVTVIINPAFNHEGQTVLCYLPSGNPLTAESILYGVAAGILLISVLLWFACYSEVMTSDKFVYLFGRILPSLSLILSMTLRFIPKFKAQFQNVREVQAGLGRDISKGSLLQRIQNTVACFSVMITWSMENAVETADSMKSRGYGTRKRTAYSVYRFEERDRAMLCFLILCGMFLLSGSLAGDLSWRYFPSIRGKLTDGVTMSLQIVYLILCLTPVITERREEKKWRSLRSKI